MPGEFKQHMVICTSEDAVAPAKELVKQQGGTIVDDTFKDRLLVLVKLPVDSVSAFQSSPHIASIEEDKGVSIQ